MREPEHPIGDSEELAALYACGAMTPEQTAEFERHLADGCQRCREELRQLDPAVEGLFCTIVPTEPDAGIRRRLLQGVVRPAAAPASPAAAETADPQIWHSWPPDSDDADVLIRGASGSGWQSVGINGVFIRRLSVDRKRNRMTALFRMAPGTSYPAHVHAGPEECLVLEGDLRAGERILRAGDYERMPPGSRHAPQRTQDGCLLLVVSSLFDELQS